MFALLLWGKYLYVKGLTECLKLYSIVRRSMVHDTSRVKVWMVAHCPPSMGPGGDTGELKAARKGTNYPTSWSQQPMTSVISNRHFHNVGIVYWIYRNNSISRFQIIDIMNDNWYYFQYYLYLVIGAIQTFITYPASRYHSTIYTLIKFSSFRFRFPGSVLPVSLLPSWLFPSLSSRQFCLLSHNLEYIHRN